MTPSAAAVLRVIGTALLFAGVGVALGELASIASGAPAWLLSTTAGLIGAGLVLTGSRAAPAVSAPKGGYWPTE
jgi:hypothetical protein